MLVIGVSGDVGSFSERVAQVYIEKSKLDTCEIKYLIHMENVLKALNNNEIEYGVFPVANSLVGLIDPAFEAMGKYQFKVIDKIDINVEHYLFAKRKLAKNEIQKIYSFAPAILQCKNFIADEFPNTPIMDWGDMALAARDLSTGVISDDCAIIGSKYAADAYNLEILKEKIQDSKDNKTMFVVVTRIPHVILHGGGGSIL